MEMTVCINEEIIVPSHGHWILHAILLINTSNHFNDYVIFLKLTIYRNTFFLLFERIILMSFRYIE